MVLRNLLEAQLFAIDRQRIGSGESYFVEKHIHAGGGQSPDRIAAAEVGTDTAHAFHHGGKVDADIVRYLRAIALGVTHFSVQARGADDRFRWYYGTRVQTTCADQTMFDQCNFGAERGSRFRGGPPCRASTNNHQVVWVSGLRVFPRGRVHMGKALALIRMLRWGDRRVVLE